MTNNYQHIMNEIDDTMNSELSIVWTCEQIIIPDVFQHTHRNVEINNYGQPVLRLYPNEIKLLYKELYSNSKKIQNNMVGVYKNTIDIKDNNGKIICTFNNITQELKAISVGTGVLKNELVNNYFNISNFNDNDIVYTDLIIIVEETPIITKIEWLVPNPLYVEPKSKTKIEFKITYSNMDYRTYVDDSYLNLLHVTNKCYGNIENGYFNATLDEDNKGPTYVLFNKIAELENIITPETLKIIVCKNKELPENVESNFVTVDPIVMVLDNTEGVSKEIEFYEELTNTNPVIRHNRMNYMNMWLDESIVELKFNENLNKWFVNSINNIIGFCQINMKSDYIDLDYYIKDLTDSTIQYNVSIIKAVDKVEWTISGDNVIYAGLSNQMVVTLYYTDGTTEDITSDCKFTFNEELLQLNNTLGTITGIAPGESEISLVSSLIPEDKIPENKKIVIIQPITKMLFDKSELELVIGDSYDLEFLHEPENATPIELKWYSTEPNIVSVNDDGRVTALSRGSADIIISELLSNETSNEETETSNEETNSIPKYVSDNILLENEKLRLSCDKFENGVGELKLADAILYTVKIINNGKYVDVKEAMLINVNETDNNVEQQLFITFPDNYMIKYNDNLCINVSNFYNKLVKGMKVTANFINENNDIIDSIIAYTDVNGNAIIQNLNIANTNSEGIATFDGIGIRVKHDNNPVGNVKINHIDSHRIDIMINESLTLNEMNKIYIRTFKDEKDDEEEYSFIITDLQANVYMMDKLLYSGYSTNGKIIINSNEEIENNFIDNKDETTDNEKLNFMIYNPTKCAVCTVVSKAIEVTSISFDTDSIVLDKDKFDTYIPSVTVLPENATYKDVSFTIENEEIARFNNDDEIYGLTVGQTSVTAISTDNPKITDTASVNVVSHKVEKVMITTSANDEDYEWYDHLNQYKGFSENTTVGKRVTNEQYDDDDFKRFYLPLNNSMQLEAQVEPSDANDTTITWLSSNSNLLRINNKGIMTALIEDRSKDLDVYGDDDISETRFANTVWVTALNKKYQKYDVCQVRITNNKITGIEIDEPSEHDIDVDDADRNGKYKYDSEHEFDYVIKVGETIEVPISIDCQDSSFGPSNYIKWTVDENNIVSYKGGSPNHDNIEDDFDWTGVSPSTVNSNKSSSVLTITGENIGDVKLIGRPYSYNSTYHNDQLYVLKDTLYGISDEHGVLELKNKNGVVSDYIITLTYYERKEPIMKKLLNDLNEDVKQELHEFMKETFSKPVTITLEQEITGDEVNKMIFNQVLNTNFVYSAIDSRGITHPISIKGTKLDPNEEIDISTIRWKYEHLTAELIQENKLLTQGIPMEGVEAYLYNDGRLCIKVPQTLTARNFCTNGYNIDNDKQFTVNFDYTPLINDELVNTDVDNYISVHVIARNDSAANRLKNKPIYLNSRVIDSYKNVTWCNTVTLNTHNNDYNTPNGPWINPYSGNATFPSEEITKYNVFDDDNEYNNNSLDAKPGTGEFIKSPISRELKIRVVATPSGLNIAWCNAYSTHNDVLNMNVIKSNICTVDKWSKNKFRYLIVSYDEDFNDLLKNAVDELSEKYKALAWFSDNEEVIRFEDVENLAYVNSEGGRTNNPNENSQDANDITETILSSNIAKINVNNYKQIKEQPFYLKINNDNNYDYDDDYLILTKRQACVKFIPYETGKLVIEYTNKDAIICSTSESADDNIDMTTTTTNNSEIFKGTVKIKQNRTYYIFATDVCKLISLTYYNENEMILNRCDLSAVTKSEYKIDPSVLYESNVIKANITINNESQDYMQNNYLVTNSNSNILSLTPKYDGKITLTYKNNGLKIKNGSRNVTVDKYSSPYTLEEVHANSSIEISGSHDDNTLISKIEFAGTSTGKTTGSNKGTKSYTVRPSYIKRVICEGTGTANVYILSPKGQVVKTIQFRVT